jgi:hypothetical protein
MVDEPVICPRCRTPVEGEVAVCPTCAEPVRTPFLHPSSENGNAPDPPEAPPVEDVPVPTASVVPEAVASGTEASPAPEPVTSEPLEDPGPSAVEPLPPSETTQRIVRLREWAEAARPLGIELPVLPSWAEEMARSGADTEMWWGVLRGIERLSQKKVVTALEGWETQTRGRLVRLAAYSVEGRLERDQMEDALHTARAGEISHALATFQQVDRVMALKERHIDQARDELERLVSLLRDMRALELVPPDEPVPSSEDLEKELRSGNLAPLKQRLRALRQDALNRLRIELPRFVAQYGTSLVRERSEGIPVELEAAELARGSREFAEGKIEESLRRFRVLSQVHGVAFPRETRPLIAAVTAPSADDASTEASRKA